MRRGEDAEQAVKTAANKPRQARDSKGRIKDDAPEGRADLPTEPERPARPSVRPGGAGRNKGRARGVVPDPRGNEAERHAHDLMMSVVGILVFTGITYGMAGHMYGVSRSTARNWACGRPIPAKNEDMIRRMHDAVHHIRSGTKGSTKAALKAVVPEFGKSRLDLLRERRYRDATKGIRKRRKRVSGEKGKGERKPSHPYYGMNPGDGIRTFIDFELTPVHKRGEIIHTVFVRHRPEDPVGTVRRLPPSNTWKKKSE